MYSLWCDCLYKLSLANHFRDNIFWLPHNLDFRSRAYSILPYLTHLRSDLSRSIFIAEKRPLGSNDPACLKIHNKLDWHEGKKTDVYATGIYLTAHPTYGFTILLIGSSNEMPSLFMSAISLATISTKNYKNVFLIS